MVWNAWSPLRAKLTLTARGEAGSWPVHGLGVAVLLGKLQAEQRPGALPVCQGAASA